MLMAFAVVRGAFEGASVLWASLVWHQKALTCGQQVPCAVVAGTPSLAVYVAIVPLHLASSLEGTLGTQAASYAGPGLSLPLHAGGG